MRGLIYTLPLCLFLGNCRKTTQQVHGSLQPEIRRHSVIYDGNGNTGGTVPVDAATYLAGDSAIVRTNSGNLVKSGHSFLGWNTLRDGKGTDHSPSSKLRIENSNDTLFARWWDNTAGPVYRITYFGNGNTSGSVPFDSTNYLPGMAVVVKSNSGGLRRDADAFHSWNSKPTGTGEVFSPGTAFAIQSNISLYASYSATAAATDRYYGFNASGHLKIKSSLTATWVPADVTNTFSSPPLVSVVWDGSKFVGFNAIGQCRTKTLESSPWVDEDLSHTFGTPEELAEVVWNGSKYIGFNSAGICKSKTSPDAPWTAEDLSNIFGSSQLVAVVWNGAMYVGFNASGHCKIKTSLTTPWKPEDLDHIFGVPYVVTVAWNGTKYVGFTDAGQSKSKLSLTSGWSTEDFSNTYGSSDVVSVVYR
jgi:hypothetical protein